MQKQRLIIGIDEVGRGPLAGPITVAAVAATMKINEIESRKILTRFNLGILNLGILRNIKNSKKLSSAKREEWNKKIREKFMYAIASVGPAIIDRMGISYAARLAVARCLKKLQKQSNNQRTLKNTCAFWKIVLDGGLYAPKTYLRQETIIKGDERHPLIAAASIVAKVRRDAYMRRLHKKFFLYGFDRHKGYGTVLHRAALKIHGLSSVHRRSFCANINAW